MYNCLLPLLVVGILIIIFYNRYQHKIRSDNKASKETDAKNNIVDNTGNGIGDGVASLTGSITTKSMWNDPVEAARLAEELESKWRTRRQTQSRMEQMNAQGEEPLNQEWMYGSSSQANRASSKMGVNTAANKDKIDI